MASNNTSHQENCGEEASTEHFNDSSEFSNEQQPLLPQSAEAEQQQHFNNPEMTSPQRSLVKYGTLVLATCLAGACIAFGLYILYILLCAPTIILLLGESHVEIEAATLVDITNDSIAFAALLRFPGWGHHTATIPFANITVFHDGNAVGWLQANDLSVGNAHKMLELQEIFHIIDQQAMQDLLSDTAESRHVKLDTRALIDMSGFGRFLPTVVLRRSIDFTLPSRIPAVGYTVHNITGPVTSIDGDGITAQAIFHAMLPYNVAANLDAVCLDVQYANVTLATACIGPTSIFPEEPSDIPVDIHVLQIADSTHEHALADIAKNIASGRNLDLVVTGSDPSSYTTSPLWLRQVLHRISLPIETTFPQLPRMHLPPIGEIVKDATIDKIYVYWSAAQSYHPWAGILGKAIIDMPNPTKANVSVEINSIVPHLQLFDKQLGPFASIDAASALFRMQQLAPLEFCVSCDCERLGLDAIPGMEHTFTRIMKQSLVSRHIALGINGTLDIMLHTSIGKLHINSMPFYAEIDKRFSDNSDSNNIPGLDMLPAFNPLLASKAPNFSLSRAHISNTTQELISIEVDLDVENPFSYGAYLSDLAMMVNYAGLHVATVGIRELALGQGQNNVTIYIDFHNHVNDPRQQMLFLEASSGKNVTIEVAGFPACTSIAPLEASLRHFSQKIDINTSQLGNVIFHVFAMSAEATIVNPVSGANIWLQSIRAIGYYDNNIALGTMEYDFTVDEDKIADAHIPKKAHSNGLLLPYATTVTTPHLPVVANETSIGWDVIRRAIGGTLDVDVYTSLQLLVGAAQLNLTVMGRNAPIKIRL
ncbi:hypothetical protein BX070DRAFT_218403 [Coemansia spiralis]|nr:hypothetical protein BX070DRAFT_218403 [Coemansia spiralis]